MKRPLFFVCLVIAGSLAACYAFFPPKLPDYGGLDGQKIVVCGRVYQKEFRTSYRGRQLLLYVSDVEILSQQSNFPIEKIEDEPPIHSILCYMQTEDEVPKIGSEVCISGDAFSFRRAVNPGGFDAGKYYASLGLELGMKDGQLLTITGQGGFLGEKLWELKSFFAQNLESNLIERDAGILKNILLGDKETLEDEVLDLYKRNGIVHILAISGQHISMLGMTCYRRLRKCGTPFVPSALLGSVIVLLYVMMTGGISVSRAAGMFFLHMLAESLGRAYDMQTAAGAVLVLMLLHQPHYLSNSGFLLSFAAVFGIGCIYPTLFVPKERRKERYREGISRRIYAISIYFRQALRMGLAVGLAMLPVQLWFYYELPVYSTLVNLVVLPLMGPVMGIGFLLAVLPGGFLAVLGAGVIHAILELYEQACLLSEGLPGHRWIAGQPEPIQVLFYITILVVVVAGAKYIQRRYQLLLILLALFVIGFRPSPEFTVEFVDVGQGDCICIRTAEEVYLVDGGSTDRGDIGTYDIVPFLKCRGIARVDALFITHADADHYNGLLALLESNVSVKKLILPDVKEELRTEKFGEIESMAQGFELPVYYMSMGTVWQEGDTKFQCLHPSVEAKGMDMNEASLVLHVSYGEFSMLLTGDVSGQGEILLAEQLQKQKIHEVTVLKVAHHGSRYSTTENFLDVLSCKVAVISCGEGNQYGHPAPELLSRLESKGVLIYRTDKAGCVTIRVNTREMFSLGKKRGRVTITRFRDCYMKFK